MVMLLQNEDGTKELVVGQVVEKESVLAIKHQDESLSFDLGRKIELNPKEFSDIIWCLFLFGFTERIQTFQANISNPLNGEMNAEK